MSAVLEPTARYLSRPEPALLRGFGLVATAPGCIAKLRKLILSLAVQGKLVRQELDDESAQMLLKALRIRQNQMIADGAIRREKVLPPLTESDIPFDLPTGWEWARLGDLANFVDYRGRTPVKTTSGVPLITAKNVRQGHINREPREFIADSAYDGWMTRGLPRVGDLLFTTEAPLGNVAAIDIAERFALAQRVICLGLYELGMSGSLKFFLMSPFLQNQFASQATGVTAQGIKSARLQLVPIPVPPLAEQHRIVARVEELMKLCDELEQSGRLADEQHARLTSTLFDALSASESTHALAKNWQRIAEHFDLLLDRPEAIDALEQTILQLAVRGLLVPQNATDEPASKLLARIQKSRSQVASSREMRRLKALAPANEDDTPFALPSGWVWARFPELGEFGRGKSKHRPRNAPALFTPGIYPLVQTGEVARAKGVVAEYHSKYSELGLAQSKLWPKGTLCITIAANIADAAILGFDACFPDSVVGFVPHTEIGDSSYLLMFMETARDRLIEFAPATAQKNINLEVLESMLIPLPPTRELKRIVARVEELRRLCAQLRKRLTDVRETQTLLADALVAQATAA